MRIWPSWSRRMKPKVGSMVRLTTVRFRPWTSATASQTGSDEPPSGSTPMARPEERTGARFRTLERSST